MLAQSASGGAAKVLQSLLSADTRYRARGTYASRAIEPGRPEQSVLVAQESLVTAQRNSVIASYGLLAAMGRLTVRSQGLHVAEYRAEEHYEAVKDKWFGLRTVDGK